MNGLWLGVHQIWRDRGHGTQSMLIADGRNRPSRKYHSPDGILFPVPVARGISFGVRQPRCRTVLLAIRRVSQRFHCGLRGRQACSARPSGLSICGELTARERWCVQLAD